MRLWDLLEALHEMRDLDGGLEIMARLGPDEDDEAVGVLSITYNNGAFLPTPCVLLVCEKPETDEEDI